MAVQSDRPRPTTLPAKRCASPCRRRTVLAGLAAVMVAVGGLVAGCAAPATGVAGDQQPVPDAPVAATPEPTEVVAPTVAPTPSLPKVGSPQRSAALFLGYWNAGRYVDMYALVSKEAKSGITQEEFVGRYTAITREATILKLSATLTPGQLEASPNQQFDLAMETALVGTLQQHNVVPLIAEPDGWKIQWLPSLIFKELTGDNRIHMFPVAKPRGAILDRAGAPLAAEGPVLSVDIVPKDSPDVAQTAKDLADVLKIPPAEIQKALDKVQGHPDWRAPIKTFTPEQLAPYKDKLSAMPGVLLTDAQQRGYANGRVGCHVVGYTGEIPPEELKDQWKEGYFAGDRVGRAGIERWAERELAGRRGGKLAVVTPDGAVWTVLAEQDARPSKHVQLTIDLALQQAAEAALGKLTGAAVVLRVDDGSILAAASNPGFDPNDFVLGMSPAEAQALFTDPRHPFQDRVGTGLYPTGSVFKTITMALVLQHGLYQAGSGFVCPGYWDGLGVRLACWKASGHGKINLFEGLAQSCDVVYYLCGQAADRTDRNLLPDGARAFGLGAQTGLLGLPEGAGVVPSPAWKQQTLHEGWYAGDAVNLAVGQGTLLATPLQVASWIAALANGGTLWTPRIVDRLLTPGGGDTPNPPKSRGTLPVSPEHLRTVRDAMRQTVTETKGWLGTAAWPFRDFPVAVAGKTGTAQTGKPKPHAWFASFAPADKPEIVVVAMVEFADGEGSEVAAPITRQIYEHYFDVPWAAHVTPEHRLCTEFEQRCPWPTSGVKRVRYGD